MRFKRRSKNTCEDALKLFFLREVWIEGTLLNGVVLSSIAQAGFVLASYCIHICLARLLGPADYGTYGVVISIVVWLESILTGGLLTAAYKTISERPQSAHLIAWTFGRYVLSFAILLFGIIAITSGLVAKRLGDARLVWLLPIASIDLFFFALYRLSIIIQSGLRRFQAHAFIHLTYSIAKVAAIVIPVYYGFGILGGLAGNVVASAVAMTLGFLFWRQIIQTHAQETRGMIDSRSTLGMVPAVTIGSLGHTLYTSADLWTTKAYAGAALAGQYLAAVTLARLFLMATLPLRSVVMPFVAGAMSEGNNTKAKGTVLKVLVLFSIMVLPVLGLIIALADPVMEHFFSAVYRPGAPFLQILAIGYVLISLAQTLNTILISTGRVWLACSIEVGFGLVSLPLYAWSVQTAGPIGAARALTITACGVTFFSALAVRRVFLLR